MTGGGSKVKPPKMEPAPAAPTPQDAAVEAAKTDIREKRRRSFSRRDTRLTVPDVNNPYQLKDKLG